MSRRPITSLSKYNNNKQNVLIFYKKWKKYNEIQLTKYKMDLNIRKMTNHPPSPVGLEQIENEKHKGLARARA